MKGTRTSLWLFLLLNKLLLCPINADQGLSTMQTHSYTTKGGSSVPATEPSLTATNYTSFHYAGTNGTEGNCLIDTEMGLIAIGSAGALIVCLLVATVVLACQICHIQRRIYAPRTSRSNMDLVSSPGYWDTDPLEAGGLIGPCDASVVLEEVKAESNMDRQAETQETKEEAGAKPWEGATAMVFDPEDKAIQLQSSSSRDSCLEIPRDLEDMPLVV